MNIKLAQNEDLTIDTKNGAVVTVPSPTSDTSLATTNDLQRAVVLTEAHNYSEWDIVCEGAKLDNYKIVFYEYDGRGNYDIMPKDSQYAEGSAYIESSVDSATNLSFDMFMGVYAGKSVTATRSQLEGIKYQLGSQSDKPLQPAGNYAQKEDLAAVATTGSYDDLTDKPTIPAAQIQSDWNQADSSAKDFIKNKPAIPTSFDRIVSQDGTVTVTAQNDGTVTIEKPGAEIDMDDPLSSLIDYLGMPAGSTFDEVRQALGLSVNATLQDAANAVPSSINQIVAVTDDLRYNLAEATPTVSSGAASVTVSDRSITSFTLESGVTSLAITPPAAVSGKARDFFCRVTVSGSSGPSTVTLGTGQTIDIGSSELSGMTTGINVLMFTEIASGHWMVSRKSAS